MIARKKKYRCDICPATYGAPQALGIHRSAAHGIRGTSASALYSRTKGAVPAVPAKRKYTKRVSHRTSEAGKEISLASLPIEEITPRAREIEHSEHQASEQEIREHTAYLYGHVETFIDLYARGVKLSRSILAARLADRLYAATHG